MLSIKSQATAVLFAAALAGFAQAEALAQGQMDSAQPAYAVGGAAATPVVHGQYPQLNAPLYPSPVQSTPSWTGGSIITNQAFAPHEMLYPHTYHAMYPPFYYKVKGSWVWTPFGMRQHEHWKLQGTEVNVKYRSHYPLFGGFVPPRVN